MRRRPSQAGGEKRNIMAQFRGTLRGIRGEVSKLGHKTSGLTADINGWHSGIRVEAEYDEKNQTDVFTVYKTGGSKGTGYDKVFTLSGGKIITPVFP